MMSYIFNDLEKTEIFKAANACAGMNFRAEHMRYEAEKVEGGTARVYTKHYPISLEVNSEMGLSLRKKW